MTFIAWVVAIMALSKGALLLLGYLKKEVFPPPLDSKAEKYWLDELASGSEEARDMLIEHNLRLVAHVVRKYETSGEELDDLISIGTVGLIKAVDTFKGDRSVRLATYAARCIDNEVLMQLRRKKPQDISIYEPIGYDKEGNEISLIDVLTVENGIQEIIEMKMQDEKIRSKMGILTKREQQVIEMRYGVFSGIRETQREVAQKLSISRSYVSRIEKRAVKKLIQAIGVDW